MIHYNISYDVASGSVITSYNPLVYYTNYLTWIRYVLTPIKTVTVSNGEILTFWCRNTPATLIATKIRLNHYIDLFVFLFSIM